MKVLFLLLFTLILVSGCNSKKGDRELKGEYLGLNLPHDSSEVFAPDIVSTEYNVRDASFSPDGNEFFYSIRGSSFYSILRFVRKERDWHGPEVAAFSGKYSDIEPCFSPDGKRLYFVSNRPLNAGDKPKDYDIWYVEKENDMWGEAKNLGDPINTEANEFYPSFTSDGTLYFCANYERGIGGEDLYCSKLLNGEYQNPKNLGDSINTDRDEFNSFISPDGSFIIFTSIGWGRGFGSGDLWISFRKENNEWRKPKNMGKKVNSAFFEYCPSITPDGRFLFFTSNRSSGKNYSSVKITYEKLIDGLRFNINGSENIYWIKSDFIKELN
jgi:Tol biopolymer transport system component